MRLSQDLGQLDDTFAVSKTKQNYINDDSEIHNQRNPKVQ